MLRKLVLAVALSLGAIACAPVPSAPVEVAQRTVLDEKAAIAAETAYTAVVKASALAIQAGVIKDPVTIARIGELDHKAYAALGVVRTAYNVGNASAYTTALFEANAAVRAVLALLN